MLSTFHNDVQNSLELREECLMSGGSDEEEGQFDLSDAALADVAPGIPCVSVLSPPHID